MGRSLSSEIIGALTALPIGAAASTPSGRAALRLFVDTYGTHVPAKVAIGGSATQMTTFQSADLRALIAGGVDADAVAGAGVDLFFLLLAGGKVSASGDASANALYAIPTKSHELLRGFTETFAGTRFLRLSSTIRQSVAQSARPQFLTESTQRTQRTAGFRKFKRTRPQF